MLESYDIYLILKMGDKIGCSHNINLSPKTKLYFTNGSKTYITHYMIAWFILGNQGMKDIYSSSVRLI